MLSPVTQKEWLSIDSDTDPLLSVFKKVLQCFNKVIQDTSLYFLHTSIPYPNHSVSCTWRCAFVFKPPTRWGNEGMHLCGGWWSLPPGGRSSTITSTPTTHYPGHEKCICALPYETFVWWWWSFHPLSLFRFTPLERWRAFTVYIEVLNIYQSNDDEHPQPIYS